MPATSPLFFWLSAEVFELYALVQWSLNHLEINIAIIAGGAKTKFKTSVVI